MCASLKLASLSQNTHKHTHKAAYTRIRFVSVIYDQNPQEAESYAFNSIPYTYRMPGQSVKSPILLCASEKIV